MMGIFTPQFTPQTLLKTIKRQKNNPICCAYACKQNTIYRVLAAPGRLELSTLRLTAACSTD